MRLMEGLSVAAAAVAVVTGGPAVALCVAGATAVVHFAAEGARWQTAPAALAVALRAEAFGAPHVLPVELACVAFSALAGAVIRVPAPPPPRGPHPVAFLDTVVGGVVMRIWYPAKAREGGADARPGGRAPWLLMGSAALPEAYMRFMGLGALQRLLRFWRLGRLSHEIGVGEELGGRGCLPLVLLSHANGATRELYSVLCAELASHGHVVCALEHTDGSSIMTRFPDGRTMEYDYEPYRIEATGDQEAYLAARAAQSEHRAQEIGSALAGLRAVNGGSCSIADGADAAAWAGRLDVDRPALMGHSFGGASALTAIVRGGDSSPFAALVLLDPAVSWAPPDVKGSLSGASEPNAALASTPVLSIFSEHFVHIDHDPNLFGGKYVGAFYSPVANAVENGRVGQGSAVFGLKGVGHYAFCDICLFLPPVVSRVLLLNGPESAASTLDTTARTMRTFVAASRAEGKADDPRAAAWAAEAQALKASSRVKPMLTHPASLAEAPPPPPVVPQLLGYRAAAA